MDESEKSALDRRSFLTGAAAGAAAVLAQQDIGRHGAAARRSPSPNRPCKRAARRRPGSDFMVDVIKSLGIEYIVRQSRIELPRAARIDDQLRRQPESRIHHLLPRRIGGRHGARLRQDRRQAAGACFAHGTVGLQHAVDGDLQRVLRSRAGVRDRSATSPDATKRRPASRVGSQRAGRRGHGARFHEVGRHPDVAARISRSPPCAPTRSR